jgi:RNA polymerase subunit RPABC4/transcription elongation factor Spt4
MDVILLEKVYKALSPHIIHKTHYGVVFGGDRGTCPECGSEELIRYCIRVSASGIRKVQLKCKTCHKMHTKTDK